MPIQYTQKALEQLKKLREDVENLRNKEYSAPEVTAFFTASSHILEEIFDQKTATEISNEFFRATMAYNSNQLLVAYNRQSGKIPQEPYDKLAARLVGLIKTVEFGMDRATSIPQAVKSEKAKTPKIFISHSSKDGDAAKLLVDLIEGMGIPNTAIYCTSAEGLGVSLRENIYSSMRKQFDEHNLFVLFLLSENYYHSPACLNEMGATWILQLPETSILLPRFDFERIKGAVDSCCIGIKLDIAEASGRLTELREQLCNFMGVNIPTDARSLNRWDSKKIDFIKKINDLPIEIEENDSKQIRILELEEKVRQLENNKITIDVVDNTLVIETMADSTVTAQQVISRFYARPAAWNGESFTGTFFIGEGLKDGYAVPMSDWLCQKLKLDPGYPVTAYCIESKGNKKIEIFATGNNADRLSDINIPSIIELQLKTVHFTYENYDSSYGSPENCSYFIFEVEKILSVKDYKQPVPEPF